MLKKQEVFFLTISIAILATYVTATNRQKEKESALSEMELLKQEINLLKEENLKM